MENIKLSINEKSDYLADQLDKYEIILDKRKIEKYNIDVNYFKKLIGNIFSYIFKQLSDISSYFNNDKHLLKRIESIESRLDSLEGQLESNDSFFDCPFLHL